MRMNIKIAFSDIDGTLLDKDRRVAPATVREVRRLTAAGIPFILISSRMPRAMVHLQDDLGVAGAPLIAYNGGQVVVEGKTVLSQAIPTDIVRTVAELNRGRSFSTGLYHGDEWYVTAMDYYAGREVNNTRTRPLIRTMEETVRDWEGRGIGAHKIMCMGPAAELDEVVTTLTELHPGRLHLYRSKDDYLEIADASISKLTGVNKLLATTYPALKPGNAIAFGDNYNDIAMLRGVGIGVAVANARDEVKAVARYVVASNKNDGVAEGLRLYVPG